jgi:hypothetical protein
MNVGQAIAVLNDGARGGVKKDKHEKALGPRGWAKCAGNKYFAENWFFTGGKMAAKIVPFPTTTGEPPRSLGKHGLALWRSVTAEYDITDSSGIELLCSACQSLDRAESLRAEIDRDGEIVRFKNGTMKVHPGLKEELASRAFVCRTLRQMGLNFEPIGAVGRPPQATTWQPKE